MQWTEPEYLSIHEQRNFQNLLSNINTSFAQHNSYWNKEKRRRISEKQYTDNK